MNVCSRAGNRMLLSSVFTGKTLNFKRGANMTILCQLKNPAGRCQREDHWFADYRLKPDPAVSVLL